MDTKYANNNITKGPFGKSEGGRAFDDCHLKNLPITEIRIRSNSLVDAIQVR